MVKAIKAAKLADQIRDYVAAWIVSDLQGTFCSITQVTLSPDLRQATLWVSFLYPDQAPKGMRQLASLLPTYRHRLSQQMQRKILPTLTAKIDNSAELNQQFDELLK